MRIILADRERYNGLLVVWAELWFKRHGLERKPTGRAGWVEKKAKANDCD